MPDLSDVPPNAIHEMLTRLSACDLARLTAVCKMFGGGAVGPCVQAALARLKKDKNTLRADYKTLYALLVQETGCLFSKHYIGGVTKRPSSIVLPGDGPKLILSSHTTTDVPVLRWKLRVNCGNGFEFGLLPAADGVHAPEAMDKNGVIGCAPDFGFSHLPFKVPTADDAVVELVAHRAGRLDVHVDMTSVKTISNNELMSSMTGRPLVVPYAGPKHYSLSMAFDTLEPMHLAMKLWAHADLEILNPATPSFVDA